MDSPSASTMTWDAAPSPPWRISDDADPVRHDCAVVESSRPQQSHDEPGVVGRRVVEEIAGHQTIRRQRGHVLEGLVLVDALVELSDPESARHVVGEHRRAEDPRDLGGDHSALAEHGEQERHQLHDVGCVAQKALALVECLVHQAHLALLQIPQAAMDELRRLRRRSGAEVVPLDQSGSKTPRRRVESHARTGDAAADDHDIEVVVSEAVEGCAAVER